MQIKGIDVSYCQPQVDWQKVKDSGVKFAIIRTGYRQKEDDKYRQHMSGATRAGLSIGVYCYCMARTVAEAKAEAAFVLKQLNGYKLDYPVFYDMEDQRLLTLSKELHTDIAIAFLEEIRKGGYYPGIYTNPDWLEYRLEKRRLKQYDLWLAHHTGSPLRASRYKCNKTMWQWGVMEVPGISGKVDGNVCYLDYPGKIRTLCGGDKDATCKYVVTTNQLNTRVLPSVKAMSAGKILKCGTVVEVVVGSEVRADGYTWVRIGEDIWVAREYLGVVNG